MAGGALYAVTAWVFGAEPGRGERRVFELANSSEPGRWLRVPQQWGTPWVLPAVGLVALARRRHRDALVAALCLPVLKATEVATKKVVERPRPLYVVPTALRDDAPVEGPAFPSGHTAIAVAATTLLAPHLLPAAASLWVVTAVSVFARVQQGAHHPGDALGGAVLGYTAATALTSIPRLR